MAAHFLRRSQRFLVVSLTVFVMTLAWGARTHAGGVIHVTTTAQGIANDGLCSLQEAIWSANLDKAVAPVESNESGSPTLAYVDTECEPGNGDDVIELEPGATYRMAAPVVDPFNPLGPTGTPIVLSNITIEAHGAQLVRANADGSSSGLPNLRAFAVSWVVNADPSVCFNPLDARHLEIHYCGVDPTNALGIAPSRGSLTLKDADVEGFSAKGGNGATGGGGGLGAGGAIYVAEGTLVVDASTFQANGAAGGNGSHGGNAGGGGGGLSGNGGTAANGGGGGGGGARGDGGNGDDECGTPCVGLGSGGGGGGGTVEPGSVGLTSEDEPLAAFRCGGKGGYATLNPLNSPRDGESGVCAGGGGGGGRDAFFFYAEVSGGNGGSGNYGGGGGGGAHRLTDGDGGHGGFGGGGGAANGFETNISGFGPSGGAGGFGGGGGAGHGGFEPIGGGGPGGGGSFAGDAGAENGGGGAALGGAIFSDGGIVTIRNSTFYGNFVVRGVAGGGGAQNGRDAGGAVFAVDGSLTVLNSTIAGNQSTGEGAGVVMYRSTRGEFSAALTLRNTIIANSVPTVRECFYTGGTVTANGSGNLITANFGCPGNIADYPGDPQLGPLQLNPPGSTPTMALATTSPAVDTGDPAACEALDQRGVLRALSPPCDIGAFELINQADVSVTKTMTSPIAAGADVTYRIDAGNAGPVDAQNALLTDTLPSGATFKSMTIPAGWNCTTPAVGSGGSIGCTNASFAVAANVTFTLAIHLPSSMAEGTQLCNAVNISSTTADPQSSNNSAMACGAVTTRADLALGQSATTSGHGGKGTASFTVAVTNRGPSDSRNVALTANSSMFVGPPPATVVASPLATCSVAGSTVTCIWTTLAAGATETVTIDVPWRSAVGQVCDSATVAAGTTDPNAINNTSSVCTGKR